MYLITRESGSFQTIDDPLETYKKQLREDGWTAYRFDIISGHTQYYTLSFANGDWEWIAVDELNLP